MPPLLPHAYKCKYFFSFRNFEVGGPLVIPTNDKAISSHGLAFPSSFPLFSSYSYDLSNVDHIEDVPMSLSGSSPNVEDDNPIQFKVGIKKRNYDAIKKFQENRATKLPWAEFFIREDGTLHIVKCMVCIEVEGKYKIFATKWDSLCKHAIVKKLWGIWGLM
jgi:hypothetical protein